MLPSACDNSKFVLHAAQIANSGDFFSFSREDKMSAAGAADVYGGTAEMFSRDLVG